MWKESIFVFDSSVLLNIYRYTPETREDFFRLLEKLKKRIWIPHQVALEYLEQRENVISQQQIIYNDIDEIKTFFKRIFLTNIKEVTLLQTSKKSNKNVTAQVCWGLAKGCQIQ